MDAAEFSKKYNEDMKKEYERADFSYEICGEEQRTKDLPSPHYADLVLNILNSALEEGWEGYKTLPDLEKEKVLEEVYSACDWGGMDDASKFIKPFIEGKLRRLMIAEENKICGDREE